LDERAFELGHCADYLERGGGKIRKAPERCKNYIKYPSRLFAEAPYINALRNGTKLARTYMTGKEFQLCERDSMLCHYYCWLC
jgi:hypothetical protein